MANERQEKARKIVMNYFNSHVIKLIISKLH